VTANAAPPLTEMARPNMRLKLAGLSLLRESEGLCPGEHRTSSAASGADRLAARSFKRDPLGGNRPMRTYLTVGITVLVLHLAAVLLFGVYRSFLTAIGGLLIHATDIADLPDQLFAGFIMFGMLLLLIATVLVYTRRRTSRRLTSA